MHHVSQNSNQFSRISDLQERVCWLSKIMCHQLTNINWSPWNVRDDSQLQNRLSSSPTHLMWAQDEAKCTRYCHLGHQKYISTGPASYKLCHMIKCMFPESAQPRNCSKCARPSPNFEGGIWLVPCNMALLIATSMATESTDQFRVSPESGSVLATENLKALQQQPTGWLEHVAKQLT